MVNNHSDNERGNSLLLLEELFFLISSKGFFICTIPDRTAHTMAPVMEHLKSPLLDTICPMPHNHKCLKCVE